LKKAKSSLTTQIRTRKIKFADFLHKRKMFEMKSISCRCDWRRQMTKHVIMFCSLMSDRNLLRRDDDALDYRRIMQFDRDMKIVVKWLIDHNLLSQYVLTSKLLYNDWLYSFVDLYIFFFFSFFIFEFSRSRRRNEKSSNSIRWKHISHNSSLARIFHVNKVDVARMRQSSTDVISK
jgi:hypothetical protein